MKLRMVSRWAVITLIVVVALIAIIHQVAASRSTSQPQRPHATPTLTGGDQLGGMVISAFRLKDKQGQAISLAAHGVFVPSSPADVAHTIPSRCP